MANNVSKRTVSVEKVSTLEREVLKESSSVQVQNANKDTVAHNINKFLFIAYITPHSRLYCMPKPKTGAKSGFFPSLHCLDDTLAVVILQ